MSTAFRMPPQWDAADHFLRTMLGFDEGVLAWHQKAACYGIVHSPEVPNPFYSPVNEDGNPKSESDRPQRIAKAREMCDQCPVKKECLVWALKTEDRYAVAGGLTPTQRRGALSKWLVLKEDLWGDAAAEALDRLATELLDG